MDLASPILDVFTRLYDCTIRCIAPMRHIQKKLQSLRNAKRELEDISGDVERKVKQLEEKQHLKRTNQVKGWLKKVESMLTEANDILKEGEQEIQNNCLANWCPRNCCFRYKLGKEVVKKLDAVKESVSKGNFDVVADKLPPPVVDERPMEDTVSTDSSLRQLWRSVQDDSVRIIGVYGMGGVGKTTLLKKLNNKFVDGNHEFDVVIWVVVSKEMNLRKIQEVIRKRVEIPDEIWNQIDDEDDRAAEIFKQLSGKKFVLLLEDLWARIDLSKLGVRLSENRSKIKIVFTSRSEEVCGHMQACRRFRVECLSQEAAWELFRQKLGEDVLNSHPDIPKLAKIVLNECKGLPLALITIGRAMACRRKPEEWQHAIKVLRSYPSKFSGMGDVVFPTLKFSYDSLCKDTLKTCFLYCSIFPEDHDIEEYELIELWIGEGFLEEFDNIYDARNEGKYIIGSLKLACLLETGEDKKDGYDYVKMHDILRDMALWLASEKNIKVLVQERVELSEAKSVMAKWKEATRISLWDAKIESSTESPSCSNLLTLLVRDSDLVRFPNNFFQSMCLLNVLDLSGNRKLIELPAEIGELVHLQYLNLSFTRIKMLPIEVKNLTRLRILHLEGMSNLQTISAGVISCLSSLEVFCCTSRRVARRVIPADLDLLQELERLEHINDISLALFWDHSIAKLLFSSKLIACTTFLRIKFPEDSHSVVIPLSNMKRMQTLGIYGCDSLVELKFYGPEEERMINRSIMPNYLPSLHCLHLSMCPIKELTWLIHIPSLWVLSLGDCPLLDEVISCDFGSSEIEQAIDIFPNLKRMVLRGLPNLKSICRQAMPFPSLEFVKICSCPNLRSLPFDSDSAKSSCLKIEGCQEWWEQLEWEDKHLFASKFVPVGDFVFLPDILLFSRTK